MAIPRRFLADGVRDIAPILPGVVPFGMISGIAAVDAGIPPGTAMAMSLIVYAGAAQLATVQLIVTGALPVVMVLTALIINLRFAMYSASLAPHFQHLPLRWRWPLAYMLADQAYAVAITRFTHGEHLLANQKHWYYFGAAVVMWATWQLSSAAGIFLGANVPPSWSLDFAIPLTFMALLVPTLRDNAAVIAALTGGAVATIAAGLPFNLGLVLAAISGIGAGLLVESIRHRNRSRHETNQ